MISMKIGTCFGFIFNNTSYEWHELQHPLGEFVEDNLVVHDTYTKFKKTPDFIWRAEEEGSEVVNFYIRFNRDTMKVECICLKGEGGGVINES